MSFYNKNGSEVINYMICFSFRIIVIIKLILQIFKNKEINIEALTIKAICNDSYLLIGGCKGKCSIFSVDGIKLCELENKHSWIWASAVHPLSKFVVSLICTH